MSENAKKLGLETEADKKFMVRIGDWQAMKLALWRSFSAWEIITKEAASVLANCEHTEGCLGATVQTEPCLPGCKDREKRLSALVILNAAKQLAPVDARKPADGPYYAPSREYFSEVIAQLGASQIENDELRAKLAATTKELSP